MSKNVLTVVAAAALAVFAQGAFAQASSPSRADVKAETKAAEKSGKLAPAGEAADLKAEKADKSAKSTKTRDERKAQARADQKSGQMAPTGEAADTKLDKADKA